MRRYHNTADSPVTVFAILERLAESYAIHAWIKPSESWASIQRRYSGSSGYVDTGIYGPNRYQWQRTEPNPALPIEYSTSYGDWTLLTDYSELSPDTFIIPQYCGGSDYSGNLVEVSNHKAMVELLEGAGLEDGTDFITYSGGYGTFDIAVRAYSLAEIDPSDAEEILSAIDGLSGYPLLDESLNSELEIESQNEAWDDWGKKEFTDELGKYFAAIIRRGLEDSNNYPATFRTLPCTEELAEYAESGDWVPEDKVSLWFIELSEYSNEYWVNEEGSSSYIDMADVVKNGFERAMTHWEDGERKRNLLWDEITRCLETAYLDNFYSELADKLFTPQHGFRCNRQWQHNAEDCPYGTK